MKDTLRRLFAGRPPAFTPRAEAKAVGDGLNHVDLCFVVDTTGSMSPFIGAARAALLDTVEALGATGGVDIHVGVVEYRDHPPQEHSFVTRHHALTGDLARMRQVINGLKADGGGDHPEAVYDGVQEAALLTEWRAHSCRFIMLVGDAPPHGYVARAATFDGEGAAHAARGRASRRARRAAVDWNADPARAACLCGLDAAQATAAAEDARVAVHALPVNDHAHTVGAFTEIALATGGECAPAMDAAHVVGRVGQMLDAEFRELSFDREVLEAARRAAVLDAGEIARRLGRPRPRAARALARLGRRGFLRAFAEVPQATT